MQKPGGVSAGRRCLYGRIVFTAYRAALSGLENAAVAAAPTAATAAEMSSTERALIASNITPPMLVAKTEASVVTPKATDCPFAASDAGT